jgi:hypothetical protein
LDIIAVRYTMSMSFWFNRDTRLAVPLVAVSVGVPDEWMFWGALNKPQLFRACGAFKVKNTGTPDVLRARLVRVGCARWIQRCGLADLTRVASKFGIAPRQNDREWLERSVRMTIGSTLKAARDIASVP